MTMVLFLLALTIIASAVISIILLRVIALKKETVNNMQETESRLQIMLDTMPLSCILISADREVLDCNQEPVTLFGLSSKQEFKEKFFDLSPEYQPDGKKSRQRQTELIKNTIEVGYYRFEWLHRKLNNEYIPTEVTLVRVKYRGEFAVLIYIRDLREILTMIHEKHKAEIAEESNKAKSRFLATMSHEIRTPLNAVLGITEIQMQNEDLSPEVREALAKINISGDLLLHIIDDILDLSKIEAGKLKIDSFRYDVEGLINDIIHLNSIRYKDKPIAFIFNIDENIPGELIGDEFRIRQILNNLLSNAFKYTYRGEVELTVRAEESPENDETVIMVFQVRDTGQGMTQEQIDKLFDEYTRFNMEANRATKGTGLGMSITSHLVRMMNGKIIVESEQDKGSVFTVHIPQKRFGAEKLGRQTAQSFRQFHQSNGSLMKRSQIVREYMPYGRVLIVDDVETNIYVAKGLLSPYGLSIDTAASGFEAINKIKAGDCYDAIFMDHMMPKMDGVEAVRIIRGMGYKRPIIALTANALSGQAEMFMENGFDNYLSKPIDIRQLNTMLNKMIRDKYPAKVIEAARKQKEELEKYAAQKDLSDKRQITEIFIKDAERTIAAMEGVLKNQFRRNNDINTFIINVHAIKSALANIGEEDASSIAFSLEQAGRNQDIELLLNETPRFMHILRKIVEKTADKNQTEYRDSIDEDTALLVEKLKTIKEACAEYDKKTIKKALADLRVKTWSTSTGKLLGIISEHLLHSEFEEIAGLLEKEE